MDQDLKIEQHVSGSFRKSPPLKKKKEREEEKKKKAGTITRYIQCENKEKCFYLNKSFIETSL